MDHPSQVKVVVQAHAEQQLSAVKAADFVFQHHLNPIDSQRRDASALALYAASC
jgi:hypothetical protein